MKPQVTVAPSSSISARSRSASVSIPTSLGSCPGSARPRRHAPATTRRAPPPAAGPAAPARAGAGARSRWRPPPSGRALACLPGAQVLGVAAPPHARAQRRYLASPAAVDGARGIAAHLVRDHVGGHRRMPIAQLPADVPGQLGRLPAMPPGGGHRGTQETGDLPADGLRPPRRLLCGQQLQVHVAGALVAVADRAGRLANRGRHEFPLRRNAPLTGRPSEPCPGSA